MPAMSSASASTGRCSYCAAELQPGTLRCWLCGSPAPVLLEGEVKAPPILVPPPRHAEHPFQFTIGGLLVVTTVVAVFLGAIRVAPGLAVSLMVLLAICGVPAVLRARVLRLRRPAAGGAQEVGTRTLEYVASFAITAAVIIVGYVACMVVAFVALLVACGGNRALGPDAAGLIGMGLLISAPIVGFIVAGWLLRLTWPRKKA
jgi:hypothetical protein